MCRLNGIQDQRFCPSSRWRFWPQRNPAKCRLKCYFSRGPEVRCPCEIKARSKRLYDDARAEKTVVLEVQSCVRYFFDCGWSLEMSASVCDKALLCCLAGYSIQNISCISHLCKTNLITGTVFRAFGTPQAFLVIESGIEKVTNYLQKNSEEIRYLNLYK